jgi:4-amino-4-deoxy-L-arabinose transferase-like glycosyltransferase
LAGRNIHIEFRQRMRWKWTHALVVAAIAMIAASVWLRVWRLDWIPGLNGDEAWYGAQAESLLSGQSFSWRTPTGNLINPFFLGLVVATHAFGGPSIGLLRSAAVVSGLAALAANYWLCGRTFDRRTALVSTTLLAILPTNIAYSRFAWDASQSLLATLIVMYVSLQATKASAPRRRRLIEAGFLALGPAVWVHPTNVFIAPMLGVAIFLRHVPRVCAWRWRWLVPAGLIAGLILLPGAWPIATRVLNPSEYAAFIGNIVGLFSGSTVLQFIPGSIAPRGEFNWHRALYDLPMTIGLLVAMMGAYRQLAVKATADRCLTIGWATCVLVFFTVAGPHAIEPHWERYGMCLIAPTVLVATRGATAWLDRAGSRKEVAAWIFAASACLWLAGFFVDYFVFFARSGGRSHVAFRTAPGEPKDTALDFIVKQPSPTGYPVQIVAADWWTYWPLKYLAAREPTVEVLSAHDIADGTYDDKAGSAAWHVRFVDGRGLSPGAGDRERTIERIVPDAEGKPLLEVSR